jgi:asparagine synthase (glutamine-hydrolysing)
MIAARQAHPALERVPRVAQLLFHRGPDDGGYLQFSAGSAALSRDWRTRPETQVALLHRRLSIIDLSDTGWQPMQTPDGRYAMVFNGEVYNFIELREELSALGHRFHSESDTEVVLAAYAQWGPQALKRFTGMFAFALLDTHERTVLLARDPFGIKPLYYTVCGDALFFASEMPALLEFASVPRQADPHRLYRFLRYGVTDEGDGTLLHGVQQLQAAHFAYVAVDAPGCVAERPYWTAQAAERADISFSEAAAGLRERFLWSVQVHLRSDVPLGTALSGGIDSSAIVAAIRALDSQAEIHAFSYVAAGTPLDEERWIDLAAASVNAHVHKITPTASELRDDLDALTSAQGEPFGSTGIYAQYRVFHEAARCGIKVMLDGQGGDEILGGYRQYLGARLASLVRQGRMRDARAFLSRAASAPGVSKTYLAQKAAEYLLPEQVQGPLRKLVGRETMPAWMSERWFRNAGVIGKPLVAEGGAQPLKAQMLHDLRATNLPALLRYEDRNSMAFSIESRVPFLTTQLVDFAFSLPEEYLIASDGTCKSVFREAMRGLVPDAILDRRDKIGFATPEAEWLSTLDQWIRPLLESDAVSAIPALRADEVRSAWTHTLTGRRRFDYQLWRIFNVIYWTEQLNVSYAS